MRDKEYIERGALISILDAKSEMAMGTPKAVFASVSKMVELLPVADVVEVVYGEWIDKPTGAYGRMQSWCSACGKHSGIGGIESNRHKPYCPNCGAKMDGERKEQT